MTSYITKILLITLCSCNSYSINKVVKYTNNRNYISAFTSKSLTRKTQIYSNLQEIENKVELKNGNENEDLEIKFNSDAFIPTERWDFADDIYLITTTATGNQRLEKTLKHLNKININTNNIKIRTFEPDNEDRVRGCYTSHVEVLKEIQNNYINKNNYKVIILEDNLEITSRLDAEVLFEVASFLDSEKQWDVFHLAYMMYVPGLALKKMPLKNTENVVKMIAQSSASVGTSAYIISKSGVDTFLALDNDEGYTEAIPNIMARLYPDTRYAAYPMVFHRAAKIGSLVNPQLDDFRKIMFNPMMYTTWERLMVSTGLENNQLFPILLISLLVGSVLTVYTTVTNSAGEGSIFGPQVLLALPLLVALWGASLFKPGNTGAGFAKTSQQTVNEK
mmetsp:Transcript_26727/g.25595  ORF Transcript_26727/g.25595 Transcript_26727/m.25595 type:complete len:392 (+) Transcript_26727:116-1291(+)